MKRPFFILSLLAVLALASCSSSKKKDEPGFTVSGLDKIMNKGYDRKKKEYDPSYISRFDQKFISADKSFKSGEYKTGTFKADKSWTGQKTFKTSEFSQGDKASRLGSEEFQGANKKSRTADKEFATKDSRFASKTASQDGKEAREADKAFATKEEREGTKSIKANKRPVIIQTPGDQPSISYSEDDVKRLLNRN